MSAVDLALESHEAHPEADGQLGRIYMWRPACTCGWHGRRTDGYYPAVQASRDHMEHPEARP